MQLVISKGSDSGQIIIPAEFNGHIENCLIDTGASISTAYSSKFFEDLSTSGTIWTWGVSGEKVASFVKTVDTLSIGGLHFKDQHFLLKEESPPPSHEFRCILGMDVLGHGAIAFDFVKKTFQFLPKIPDRYTPRTLDLRSTGYFTVPFSLNSQALNAVWDTGASSSVVDPKIVKAHPALFEHLGTSDNGIDIVSSRSFSFEFYRMKQAKLADFNVKDTIVISKDLNMAVNVQQDAIIGFDLISRFNWMFDLRRKLWTVYKK